MVKNFVSVSGITDYHQLREVYNIYQKENLNYPLTIGYQVSDKSINQGTQNPRQPKFSELGDLCQETLNKGFIPAIHYYTRDNEKIPQDMEKIVKKGIIPNSSLVQFNTLPPYSQILKNVKDMGFRIILKVAVSNKQSSEGGYKVWKGEQVQDVSKGELSPLLDQILSRADLIDYAMFDASHGTGLELDLNENSLAIRFGKAIIEETSLINIGIIYAGGIGPSNVKSVVRSLNTFFPKRTSIDSEGKVRIDNRLDLNLVREYLVGYASAL